MKSLTIRNLQPLPTTPNEEKASWKQSTTVLPPLLQEVVVDILRKKPSRDRVLPPEVNIDAPRTKGAIVGNNDDEQVDELPFRKKGKSSVHNHQSMDK